MTGNLSGRNWSDPMVAGRGWGCPEVASHGGPESEILTLEKIFEGSLDDLQWKGGGITIN